MPSYRLPSPHERPPLRRRASGLTLALGVNLAVVLALIGIGYRTVPVARPSETLVVDLLPDSPSPAPAETRRVEKAERTEPRPVRLPPPPIVIPSKPPIAPEPRPDWIEMTKEEYAAADIGKMPRASESAGFGRRGDSEQVGVGPNGQVLYAAEWAREPTNAELGGYLPPNWRDGWGQVACRTVPGHRVEDCVEIASFPRGSRFASAVRQAAWQFRVRPPRKNGRELVGEWVQIRIEYVRN